MGECAQEQGGFAGFGDGGAGAEDVVILALDGAEDFEAAAGEEVEVEGQLAVDLPMRGRPALNMARAEPTS